MTAMSIDNAVVFVTTRPGDFIVQYSTDPTSQQPSLPPLKPLHTFIGRLNVTRILFLPTTEFYR